MCIHFTELKLTLHCPVWKCCLWGICEGILSGSQRSVVSKEMSSYENWREAFWATALQRMYSSHRVKPFFGLSPLKTVSLESEEGHLGTLFRIWRTKKKDAFCETSVCHVNSSHSVKLLLHWPVSFCLCLVCEGIYGSAFRLTVKKEISSDRNWKEAFWGTVLWGVHSSHRIITFFS